MNKAKSMKLLTGNQRGSALILVIILLVVASVLVTSVALLAQANTKMTSVQDQGIRSYYIARSGAELAYEVVFANSDVRSDFIDNRPHTQTESVVFSEGGTETGSADITIDSFVNAADNALTSLRITSVGKAADVDNERTIVLTIEDMNNEGEFFWSR